MKNVTNLSKSSSEYNVFYTDMRGVDLSGDGSSISSKRFAYLENFYRDYEGDGAGVIESFPGFRRILTLGGKINCIAGFRGDDNKEYIVVHAGTSVYRFAAESRDSLGTPTAIAALLNCKSRSFVFGSALYLMDGTNMLKITRSSAATVSENGITGYIPITYRDGAEYEQRNLLSAKFREIYHLTDAEIYSFGTAGLKYRISDSDEKECVLYGAYGSITGELCVPSSVKIGNVRYTVVEIADSAFLDQTGITSLHVASGVRRIGILAFSGCTSLVTAVLPDTVLYVEAGAFDRCSAMTDLRVGTGIVSFGLSAFTVCPSFARLHYGGTQRMYAGVDTSPISSSVTVDYDVPAKKIHVCLPINSPASSLTSVKINGVETAFTAVASGGYVTGARLTFEDRSDIDGKDIVITGNLISSATVSQTSAGFLSAYPAYGSHPSDALLQCKVCESYDGRIFLAGNPSLPNVVFYSSRDETGNNNPLYFGELNYFSDGVGGFPVKALLSAGGSLAVFKAGDDGSGSIYYHTPKETGMDLIPKIYPVNSVHSGVVCEGAAFSFFDDPLFVSKSGITALEKTYLSGERKVTVRSHNVNNSLLSKDLSEVSMTEWCGYLVVGAGDTLYLADSRSTFLHETGSTEYEWFILTGIGAYAGDDRVYRYSSVAWEGSRVSDKIGEKAPSPIYQTTVNGAAAYYVQDGNIKYAVHPTEEYTGGTFSPECAVFATGDLLFFGTESGKIFVVNNDKRGVAPSEISSASDFSAAEYAAVMGRRIHPSFYAFDRHAPRYALKTKKDNCGIPHLQKSTCKHSLVLKLRSFSAGSIRCEAGTERSGYTEVASLPSASFSFEDLDFDRLTLATDNSFSVALAEKEKRWTEKQISIYSDDYCSPIGIYSICYRFTVSGKIK